MLTNEFIRLIGHIGSDPECKESGGKKLLCFPLLVSKDIDINRGNGRQSHWWAVAWENPQDTQSLKKGGFVEVMGDPFFKIYQNPDGQSLPGRSIRAFSVYSLPLYELDQPQEFFYGTFPLPWIDEEYPHC